MILIGLGHRARQGKDEVGKSLARMYKFDVFHFADLLKEECAEYFGWSEINKNILAKEAITFENWKKVRDGEEWEVVGNKGIRSVDEEEDFIEFGNASLLQWWGTDFRRGIDPDYWVKATMRRIQERGCCKAVICDVRFLNEAKYIKAHGGIICKIERIGQDFKQIIATDRDPNHPSEISLKDYEFDYEISIMECDVPEILQWSFDGAARCIYDKARGIK